MTCTTSGRPPGWPPAALYTSTDAAFSNPVLCAVTTQTTYVVTGTGTGCHPGLNTTIYWRVIAIDYPRAVNGFPSPIQKFAYSRSQVNQTSPAAGASGIEIPTLSWDPLPGAESYLVKIANTGGSVVDQTSTYSTSYTPLAQLPTSGNPYRWTVQAVDSSGIATPLPAFGAGRTFSVSGTVTDDPAIAPLTLAAPPNGSTSARFPALRWEPMAGATRYEVFVGASGGPGVHSIGASFTYPAATSTAQADIAAGTYDWYVRALNSGGAEPPSPRPARSSSATRRRRRDTRSPSMAPAWSPRAAPGRWRTPIGQQICTVTSTPVLDWAPESGAASYRVYLSRDRNFQNQMPGSPFSTTNTRWTPTAALPDSRRAPRTTGMSGPARAAPRARRSPSSPPTRSRSARTRW